MTHKRKPQHKYHGCFLPIVVGKKAYIDVYYDGHTMTITSLVTKLLKNGTFWTENTKYVPYLLPKT